MSVENQVLSYIVEQGQQGLSRLYAEGCGKGDFLVFEEEFDWISRRGENRLPINRRLIQREFPDFEFLPPDEPFEELVQELKAERAMAEVNTVLAHLADNMSTDNAFELAAEARDRLAEVTRLHSPRTNERLTDDTASQVRRMREGMKLAAKGVPVGIPTGIDHLDYHWGGYQGGRMYVCLGRPGEGKSLTCAIAAWTAKKLGYRVGFFSPEMSADEHRCRVYTLASADKQIQKEVGFSKPFKNRALMDRRGFNIKTFQSFLDYLAEMPTDIHFLTGKDRREKITVPYIASQVEDLGLDLLIIDPIYKLRSVRRRGNQWEEIGELSDAIQDVSETYDVPVIVTNQAHRQGGASGDAPGKDRSFNSDVPIQNADHVLGIKHLSQEHLLICRCTKSRFGAQDFRFDLRVSINNGYYRSITPIHGNNGDGEVGEDELADVIHKTDRALQDA